MVGGLIAALNLNLILFVPIFVASALAEWFLIRTRGTKIKIFNWNLIAKMPRRIAAKSLFLIMYHAFLFMLLGYWLALLLK